MEQLKEGSVVTVRFYKPKKALAYIKENPDCVSYKEVQNYSMDLRKGTLTIGQNVYNISAHVVVVSDGKETDMMEVNQMDVLSVWGYKNMIYGIYVEKGHGYLRLQKYRSRLQIFLDDNCRVFGVINTTSIHIINCCVWFYFCYILLWLVGPPCTLCATSKKEHHCQKSNCYCPNLLSCYHNVSP